MCRKVGSLRINIALLTTQKKNYTSESAANPGAMLAVRFANTERCVCLGRGQQVFQNCRINLKILSTIRESWSKFHTDDPQILRVTVQNSDARAKEPGMCALAHEGTITNTLCDPVNSTYTDALAKFYVDRQIISLYIVVTWGFLRTDQFISKDDDSASHF
jgi:hypothetical protein